METYGFDAGPIAILAIAFFVGCLALRSWIRRPKRQTGETEVLVQIRNELRDANASLRQLKDAAQHQQTTLEKTTVTLEAMRGTANDHASDVKSAIETVSGAVDAARAEGTARHETTSEAIEAVRTTAADAQEKANDVYLAANGLRRKIDEINEHVGAIPQLRGGIDRLQQGVDAVAAIAENIPTLHAGIENLQLSVTAVAEAMPKKRTSTARRQDNKGGAKANAKETPAKAAAQPSDAGKPAGAGKPADATPPSKPAEEKESPAAAAPAGDSSEPGKPGGGATAEAVTAAATTETGTDAGSARQTRDATNGETAKGGETAGDGKGNSGDAAAQNGDDTEQAPPARPGADSAEQQTQATQ